MDYESKYQLMSCNRREKVTAITIGGENGGTQSDWILPDGNIDKKLRKKRQ